MAPDVVEIGDGEEWNGGGTWWNKTCFVAGTTLTCALLVEKGPLPFF